MFNGKLTRLLNLKYFYHTTHTWQVKLAWLAVSCLSVGLIWGLFIAPADYQQGDAFRILYVHVPSAFLSLMLYAMMASYAFIFLIWRIKLADIFVQACAPIGALFTGFALITGSIWGKPMWGTWWIWDARLTSELILLFIYMSIILLRQLLPVAESSSRIIACWVLVGAIDLPIIHYSVNWWHTLHQGATLAKFGKPAIAPAMLWPLLFMLLGCIASAALIQIIRMRTYILQREANANWLITHLNESR